MANNSKRKQQKVSDLSILAAMTTLRLDITSDYRRHKEAERRRESERLDAFRNMRFYVAPDGDAGEMRIFALSHPISPMAFYTRQGAQDSMDKHQAEWRLLFHTLAPAERSA